ncbi:hypothetical protein BB8028_0010g00170 [Beauveria bassiana]|nr:hypothetical protein BB8028_0010g00170 [Beauveria bassiana]
MSRPSISDVIELLLRHATHAAETEREQNLRCPEPRCTYVSDVSDKGYQALQRHYLKHVPCVFKCPFCSKPLKSVSGVARHPDACKDRNGRSIPDDSKLRRVEFVKNAYAKLRLAKYGKQVYRGNLRPSSTAHRHRSLSSVGRDSDSSTNIPFSASNTDYSTTAISGTTGQINSSALFDPISATTPLSDSGNCEPYNTAGNCFSGIDNTSLHIVGNSSSAISPASMLFGAQTHHTGSSANSADPQRALSLSYPADGTADFVTARYTDGDDPSYQTGSYFEGHASRALGLTYTMDGAANATEQYVSVSGLGAVYQPEVFPAHNDTYRALGLMYTADGSTYYANHA